MKKIFMLMLMLVTQVSLAQNYTGDEGGHSGNGGAGGEVRFRVLMADIQEWLHDSFETGELGKRIDFQKIQKNPLVQDWLSRHGYPELMTPEILVKVYDQALNVLGDRVQFIKEAALAESADSNPRLKELRDRRTRSCLNWYDADSNQGTIYCVKERFDSEHFVDRVILAFHEPLAILDLEADYYPDSIYGDHARVGEKIRYSTYPISSHLWRYVSLGISLQPQLMSKSVNDESDCPLCDSYRSSGIELFGKRKISCEIIGSHWKVGDSSKTQYPNSVHVEVEMTYGLRSMNFLKRTVTSTAPGIEHLFGGNNVNVRTLGFTFYVPGLYEGQVLLKALGEKEPRVLLLPASLQYSWDITSETGARRISKLLLLSITSDPKIPTPGTHTRKMYITTADTMVSNQTVFELALTCTNLD